MSNFTQRSKSYTDARLFKIVREAEKYAPEAVAAAEAEIERRGLNAEDFPSTPTVKSFATVGKIMAGLAPPKVHDRPDDVLDWIEQPDQGNTAGEKYLLYLMIVIGLTGLVGIYGQWDYLTSALGPDANEFDPIAIIIILAILFQFFLVYLLWCKNRIGYYITACMAAIAIIGTAFQAQYLFDNLTNYGGLKASLVPTISTGLFLTNLGFSVAATWLVTRKDLMDIFGITKKSLIIAMVIGVVYSLSINFLFTL